MGELIVWALFLGGALAVTVAAQYLQLFVRRRWQVRVRLPDPVAYTPTPSFRCDAEIAVCIHSSKPVRLRFNRCTTDGFTEVRAIEAAASLQQPRMHRWSGFNWPASVTLAPDTLPPGFYRIDVEHRDDASRRWHMLLLVRPVASPRIAIVTPTHTWNAYNDFGGLSNYVDRATPQPLRLARTLMRYLNISLFVGERHWLLAVPLPERRPNARINRDLLDDPEGKRLIIPGQAALVRFLEQAEIPYELVSDRDFACDMAMSRNSLIIFNTHSEYWSEEMAGRLDEAIARGCSAAFLSGNNMYRRVQTLDSGIAVTNIRTPAAEIVPLVGTYYDPSGYETYDAYRVADPGHWCFEGLRLEEGSEFGQETPARRGASGFETDKIRPSGKGFRVVAVGKNREGPAFMVCRDLPGGSFVFNVSSVSFTPHLDDDPVIRKLVLNLIRRALAHRVMPEAARD